MMNDEFMSEERGHPPARSPSAMSGREAGGKKVLSSTGGYLLIYLHPSGGMSHVFTHVHQTKVKSEAYDESQMNMQPSIFLHNMHYVISKK